MTRILRILLLLGLGLAACGGAAPPGSAALVTPDPSELPLLGFALVRRDAWLHSAPRAEARLVRELTPDELARQRFIEPVFPVRILSAGAFVEVETVEPEDHCHTGSPKLEDLRVRFFVRPDDLSPVLVRPVELRYGDGTSASLSAGVAVRRSADADLVVAGHTLVGLRLPGDAIGLGYASAPRVDPEVRLAEDDPFVLRSFDQYVWANNALRLGGAPSVLAGGLPLVWDRAEHQGGLLVTLRDRCTYLVVEVEPRQIRSFAKEGGVRGGVVGKDLPPGDVTTEVREGAIVSWRDGRIAGETRKRIVFPGRGVRDGQQVCFVRALRDVDPDDEEALRPEQRVTLCFDANDLTVNEPSRPAPIF